jgi:hypothetical protein
VVLLAGIGGLLSNFLGAGVGTSLMYPIGNNKLQWSVVEEQQPSSKCISDLKDRLSQAYHLATEAAQKAREKQKEGYNIRIRGAVIKPGDRVLVKIVSFDGKHKLADCWTSGPSVMVESLYTGSS